MSGENFQSLLIENLLLENECLKTQCSQMMDLVHTLQANNDVIQNFVMSAFDLSGNLAGCVNIRTFDESGNVLYCVKSDICGNFSPCMDMSDNILPCVLPPVSSILSQMRDMCGNHPHRDMSCNLRDFPYYDPYLYGRYPYDRYLYDRYPYDCNLYDRYPYYNDYWHDRYNLYNRWPIYNALLDNGIYRDLSGGPVKFSTVHAGTTLPPHKSSHSRDIVDKPVSPTRPPHPNPRHPIHHRPHPIWHPRPIWHHRPIWHPRPIWHHRPKR